MEKTLGVLMTNIHKTEVSPSRIGNELDQLRRDSLRSSNEKGNPTQPAVRATLSNMILIAPCPQDAAKEDYVSICIEDLAKTHPSRFFIITINDALATRLKTTVASRDVSGNSDLKIQTEEIHIEVHPESIQLVKNLVLAQLIPDIETIAIELFRSKDHPYREKLVEVLHDMLDTLISYSPFNPLKEGIISSPAEGETRMGKSVAYRNLCWPMTSKWRALISEQFDTDQALHALSRVKNITITYSDTSSNKEIPGEALLLASWILSSLEISVTSRIRTENSQTLLACHGKDKNTRASLIFAPTNLEGLSYISEVTIEMEDSETSSFQTNCTYLPALHAIEVTSGGKGDAKVSESNIGDTCEFYLRRCAVGHYSISQAALELIRGDTPLDIYDAFVQLRNFCNHEPE
jgi:hypothetical protein